LTGSIYTV